MLAGDCIEVMAGMEADSADAIVTDPPYGIGFMGRDWDTHERTEFETWCRRWGEQALRVVKPGGHLIAFGGSRTHHRLMAGLEDAGWEIRDCGVWLYRTGFPKSLDVSKALDRAAGAERQIVGSKPSGLDQGTGASVSFAGASGRGADGLVPITAPATEDAQRWEGWGTALKPAIEPWVLARRPLSEGSVAANVQRWGTGALNIDACRAEMTDEERAAYLAADAAWRATNAARTGGDRKASDVYGTYGITESAPADGRWPANVLTLEDDDDDLRHFRAAVGPVADYPKAGSDEKPWDDRSPGQRCLKCGKQRLQQAQSRCQCAEPEWDDGVVSTHANAEARDDELHPTVKPLDLMRHLVRLVTPPDGTVLDPFAGSGTTGEAAMIEGLDSVLIEREAAYRDLIDRRIARTRGDTGAE